MYGSPEQEKHRFAVKILIVEDSPVDAKVVASVTERFGVQSHIVDSGLKAWTLLEADASFSLVITDYLMPDMNGLELVQKIRSSERTRDIPVLVISAFIPLSQVASVLAAGASRFQAKPLKVKELEEDIRILLQRLKEERPALLS